MQIYDEFTLLYRFYFIALPRRCLHRSLGNFLSLHSIVQLSCPKQPASECKHIHCSSKMQIRPVKLWRSVKMLDVHLLRLKSHEISSSHRVTCCFEQANRAAASPHERSLHLSSRTPWPSIHNPALIIDLTLLMRSHRRSEVEIKNNFRCFSPRESKINESKWRRNFTKVQCLNNCLQSFWRNKTLVTQWETSSLGPCLPQPQTDGRKIYLTYVTNFVALCCALKCISS